MIEVNRVNVPSPHCCLHCSSSLMVVGLGLARRSGTLYRGAFARGPGLCDSLQGELVPDWSMAANTHHIQNVNMAFWIKVISCSFNLKESDLFKNLLYGPIWVDFFIWNLIHDHINKKQTEFYLFDMLLGTSICTRHLNLNKSLISTFKSISKSFVRSFRWCHFCYWIFFGHLF